MPEISILYSTTSSLEEAEFLSQGLIENKLAACVNVIPKMTSYYEWDGKIEKAQEVVLIIKTITKRESEVIEFIEKNHRYETPCVISLPVKNGSLKFLNWIQSQVH